MFIGSIALRRITLGKVRLGKPILFKSQTSYASSSPKLLMVSQVGPREAIAILQYTSGFLRELLPLCLLRGLSREYKYDTKRGPTIKAKNVTFYFIAFLILFAKRIADATQGVDSRGQQLLMKSACHSRPLSKHGGGPSLPSRGRGRPSGQTYMSSLDSHKQLSLSLHFWTTKKMTPWSGWLLCKGK